MARGAVIQNNHSGPLGVGSVAIPAGKTARVEDWPTVKRSNAVQIWLENEVISIVSEDKGNERAANATTGLPGLPGLPPMLSEEDQKKTALIDELRSLTGVERTLKSSLESLQKQVDEARAANKT